MPAKKKEESIPLILYPILIVLVILYIVFTILTLGIFLPDDDKKETNGKSVQKSSEEERLRVSLERKQNRLKTIGVRISELELIKRQITRREKRILFGVRFLITGGLVLINWFYIDTIANIDYKKGYIDQFICSTANLNTFILLGYALPAYLFYGTAAKFTAAMKRKITFILKKKHIPSLSELQLLKNEETQLRHDIHYLKLQLEKLE
ncbi:hypothetical protein [Fluviicola sp.]|uniref:hypothetical protein n=1 Tax=Fluviicola sp. TaxID=1917219 RepID=UPI002605E2F3|nr:hypothetical protein [Fluviicola sp.]